MEEAWLSRWAGIRRRAGVGGDSSGRWI
jgi:hypothetical protein